MPLISHVYHTEVGITLLVTNNINLEQLHKFVLIEMEPVGDGMDLTIHDTDGSEEDACRKAVAAKLEIDTLIGETVPFDSDRV
jgi:hypothetical protein